MYASKLTLSDEFKEKAKKGISTIRKGELMWQRLEEADRTGTLQLCATRQQLGECVGITNKKSAYTWAANMVSRGYITETFRSFQDGHALYEYHLGKKPKYEFNGGKRKEDDSKKQESYEELKKRLEAKETQPIPVAVEVLETYTEPNEVDIKVDDNITIKITGANINYLANLIKKLCN